MRHGTSNRRSRNRSNNNNNRGRSNGSNGGGNNRAKVFDSNGPEVRIRGTAHQIFEKYTTLAKDANSVGDLVLAESYLQHAEHYQRMISVWDEQAAVASAAAAAEKRSNEQTYSSDNNQKVDGNKKEAQNDDLSLPASILGGEVKVASEGVRVSESALEDA